MLEEALTDPSTFRRLQMKHLLLLNFILFTSTASFAVMNGRPANPALSAATVTFHLSGGARHCTGVIVHPKLILTAGHCTEGAEDFGATMDVTNEVNGRGKRSVRVQWKTAKGYTESDEKEPEDIGKDFAYIYSETDLVKMFKLDPSQLPKVAFSNDELRAALTNANFEATGYGYGIHNSGGRDGEKRELKVRVGLFDNLNILSGTSLEAGVGVCQGDSGGGVFVTAADGRLLLMGNLSGIVVNESCGSPKSYGFYSYTHQHICWVQKSSKVNLGAVCSN